MQVIPSLVWMMAICPVKRKGMETLQKDVLKQMCHKWNPSVHIFNGSDGSGEHIGSYIHTLYVFAIYVTYCSANKVP